MTTHLTFVSDLVNKMIFFIAPIPKPPFNIHIVEYTVNNLNVKSLCHICFIPGTPPQGEGFGGASLPE